MFSRSVFYRSPGCRTEVCSRLISTVERSKTRHTGDGSKWCVIACSILPPPLRNVSQEFTAPRGDAAASMCFLAFRDRSVFTFLPRWMTNGGDRSWTPPISLTKLNKCSSDLSHDPQGFSSARGKKKRKTKCTSYCWYVRSSKIIDLGARMAKSLLLIQTALRKRRLEEQHLRLPAQVERQTFWALGPVPAC